MILRIFPWKDLLQIQNEISLRFMENWIALYMNQPGSIKVISGKVSLLPARHGAPCPEYLYFRGPNRGKKKWPGSSQRLQGIGQSCHPHAHCAKGGLKIQDEVCSRSNVTIRIKIWGQEKWNSAMDSGMPRVRVRLQNHVVPRVLVWTRQGLRRADSNLWKTLTSPTLSLDGWQKRVLT